MLSSKSTSGPRPIPSYQRTCIGVSCFNGTGMTHQFSIYYGFKFIHFLNNLNNVIYCFEFRSILVSSIVIKIVVVVVLLKNYKYFKRLINFIHSDTVMVLPKKQ